MSRKSGSSLLRVAERLRRPNVLLRTTAGPPEWPRSERLTPVGLPAFLTAERPRLVDCSINTVTRELVVTGNSCARLHDELVGNVLNRFMEDGPLPAPPADSIVHRGRADYDPPMNKARK